MFVKGPGEQIRVHFSELLAGDYVAFVAGGYAYFEGNGECGSRMVASYHHYTNTSFTDSINGPLYLLINTQ